MPTQSLKSVHAAEYYLDNKRRGGAHLNLGQQDKARADLIVAWYDGMATADELADFSHKTKERGAQRHRVGHITDLIKERFYDTFDALPNLEKPKLKMKMPPVCQERQAARHVLDLQPNQIYAEI